MENHQKYPEPLEVIIVVLGALFASFILSTILVAIGIGLIGKFSFIKSLKIILILVELLFLLIIYRYLVFRKYNLKQILRLQKIQPSTIPLSILIGFSLIILSDELDRLVQFFVKIPDNFLELQFQMLKADTSLDWILVIIGAVLLASFTEEVIFRGYMQTSLESKGNVTRAVILTSLSWTIMHISFYWAVQIFLIGIIFGFVAWRTNSTYPTIIIHALNNLIVLFFLNFQLEQSFSWYLVGGHVNPIILIVSVLVLVFSIRKLSALYTGSG